MKRIVVIGAGFAGQTAALYLGKKLGKDHSVTVINASDQFYFIPSFVWVGVGRMAEHKTHFPLKPVFDRFNVKLVHGWAHGLDPEERFVRVKPVSGGEDITVPYDYLLVATGPKLNFAGTEGLGPDNGGHTVSICSLPHATHARDSYMESIARMERGEKQRFVIGTGHPTATCQGAAFEYISNIHQDLLRRGLRDKADIHWLSNEQKLGDFGIRGIEAPVSQGGVTSEDFLSAVFDDFDISYDIQKGVTAIEKGCAHYEDFEGKQGETSFDFAMLIPQFTGQRLTIESSVEGADLDAIASKIFNPGGFVKVDAQYGLPYEKLEMTPDAWPGVYQNPSYPEIFAAGIAFAPPGPISIPHTNPNGLSISAAPPRTGMVSGIIGRLCALNIADLVTKGRMTHSERMTEMAAACIASMGDSLWNGSAGTIMIYPVVPNYRNYPNEGGRDGFVTHLEMGLAGAWMKRMIHTTFMHKLQGRIGWQFIPE
jgi:sulfide:quinone oxidoreductase